MQDESEGKKIQQCSHFFSVSMAKCKLRSCPMDLTTKIWLVILLNMVFLGPEDLLQCRSSVSGR